MDVDREEFLQTASLVVLGVPGRGQGRTATDVKRLLTCLIATKKKPRTAAGLKLNERYEERPDRATAEPATLMASCIVDRNRGLGR
jgi:hypothetical protein